MTTAVEIIQDAYRLANVIDEIEVPSAEQGVSALRSLNRMMGQWDRDGVKLGWSQVEDLDDTLPLDFQDERAVLFNLAVELSGEFGLEPSAWVAQIASGTYAQLSKAHRKITESSLDHLPAEDAYHYANPGAINSGG